LGGGGSVAAASKKMEEVVRGGPFCNGLGKGTVKLLSNVVFAFGRWRRLGYSAGSSFVDSAVSRNENV
jgi:hypothetical protein